MGNKFSTHYSCCSREIRAEHVYIAYSHVSLLMHAIVLYAHVHVQFRYICYTAPKAYALHHHHMRELMQKGSSHIFQMRSLTVNSTILRFVRCTQMYAFDCAVQCTVCCTAHVTT